MTLSELRYLVALADLRPTLKAMLADATSIERVELRLPLPILVQVEILDTPGFNAPDPDHTRVARSAFEEADVAVWLLDATQAMKQSERVVLDEARRIRLPVQMLGNKADRLSESDMREARDFTQRLVTSRLGRPPPNCYRPPRSTRRHTYPPTP